MKSYSLVVPMYNVARYLPDFFASLLRQTIGFEKIELILVNDGSTDNGETLQLAQDFCARHPDNVTVLSKANGGQASARNMGLAHVTAEWVSFPDPDDVLNDTYFEAFETAARTFPAQHIDALSARILLWHENDGRLLDNHALAGRFHHGNVVRHISSEPAWIQPHVTSALIRTSVIRDFSLQFPEELRLRFEDGCFITEYLLHLSDPAILFVPGAHYHYRQRSDSSSTIQSTKADPNKYVDHLEFGFLRVIALAESIYGHVPEWLQNLILYDQFWIFRSSQRGEIRHTMFPQQMYTRLHDLLPRVLEHIDDETIRAFSLMPIAPWMREAMLIAKGSVLHGPVFAGKHDTLRGLQAFIYRHGPHGPAEEVRTDDRISSPRHAKDQGLEYVGKPIVWQRTLWLPDDLEVEIRLDGVPQEVYPKPFKPGNPYAAKTSSVTKAIGAPQPASRPTSRRLARLSSAGKRIAEAITRRLTRGGLRIIRRDVAIALSSRSRRFKDAWVFIDRDVDANDSAEDMYWWLRRVHPEINAWFVVRKNTPTWERLSSQHANLIAYGTPTFFALMSNAIHLASSHADRFITNVLPRKITKHITFTFLQHGVIKGDISGWLNSKSIQVFVTSTEAEYDYITGPSPYKFGTKEVRLTGLPRHDILLQMDQASDRARKRTILIAPTWRDYLVGAMTTDSATRASVTDFAESLFARSWSEFLHSPRLRALHDRGYDVMFVPHPNMHQFLHDFRVPTFVSVKSYAEIDIRNVLVATVALVTDYSSMAFNAAYLKTPVIYFQFDRDTYSQAHTERPGYFDYHRDGFGPVCMSSTETAAAVADAIDGGLCEPYATRAESTFPVRDGKNRQRVFAAMLASRQKFAGPDGIFEAKVDRWSNFS